MLNNRKISTVVFFAVAFVTFAANAGNDITVQRATTGAAQSFCSPRQASNAAISLREALAISFDSYTAGKLPDGKKAIKSMLPMLSGYSKNAVTQQDFEKSPLFGELTFIARLVEKGYFLSAREYAISIPSLKNDKAGKVVLDFLLAVYAPVSDAFTQEDAEFAAALNNARKKLDIARNVLGTEWQKPGVSLYLQGITYTDLVAQKAGKLLMCQNVSETTIDKVIKIGKHVSVE